MLKKIPPGSVVTGAVVGGVVVGGGDMHTLSVQLEGRLHTLF